MNTPSKEALEAARDVRCKIQHPFGWQPIEDPEMAAIIDRHFELLRRDNATLAGRLTAAELERDGLGARAEQAEARVKELEATISTASRGNQSLADKLDIAEKQCCDWKRVAEVRDEAVQKLQIAKAELAEALREKQEKHPDTERIDWLESQPSKYDWGVTLDHGCVFVARNKTSGHATLREAIDAARNP